MAKIVYKGQVIAGGNDYQSLPDKPVINNVEVDPGSNTSESLNIMWHGTQDEYDNLTVRNNETIYIIQDENTVPVVVDATKKGDIVEGSGIRIVNYGGDKIISHKNTTTGMTLGSKTEIPVVSYDNNGHVTEAKTAHIPDFISGIDVPTADIGEDGDIYIRYYI